MKRLFPGKLKVYSILAPLLTAAMAGMLPTTVAAATYFENAYNVVPNTGVPSQLRMPNRFGDFADIGGWANNYEPEIGDEVGAFWTNQSDEEILVGVTTVNELQASQNIYGLLTIYGELPVGFGGGTELSHGLKEGATIYFRVYPLSRLSEYPANPTMTFVPELEPGRHDLAVELPPTATPTVTPTASATPSAAATATPTISLTPTVTPAATATPTASVTPVATATPMASVTPTATPSITPAATATPTAFVTPTATPSITPAATAIPTASIAPTPSPAPTAIPPLSRWYLPAGALKSGQTAIDTYILVANPNQQTAPLRVDFVGRSGFISFTEVQMSPQSRRTFRLKDSVHFEDDSAESVSTIVKSTGGLSVFAERAMYFPGGGGWNDWTGGHATIGITDLAGEWNLSEGATHLFDHFIHVLNPGPDSAPVTAEFMGKDGFAGQTFAVIAPLRNWTIPVNAEVGERDQVSTRVISSGGEVAVDRTMYWPPGGAAGWIGGHSSRGISEPAAVWHLAEGANHIFDHYVLVSNPGPAPAFVNFTFMDREGNTAFHQQTVAPRSRYTVRVNDIPGWEEKDQVSTKVAAAEGGEIFAERAMYWPRGEPKDWRGGHNSIASSKPAFKWHLAEGANHIFDHYVLVSNPGPAPAFVNFTFMDREGNTAFHQQTVAPRSRYTVRVNDIPGWDEKDQVSTAVKSSAAPILVERAMYWPRGEPKDWWGGHATIGIEEP